MSHISEKLCIINTGKGFSVPKSFTAAGTSFLGRKGLIHIKMDRPLGGVLFYALVNYLNIVMKAKDLLQHCFFKHVLKF